MSCLMCKHSVQQLFAREVSLIRDSVAVQPYAREVTSTCDSVVSDHMFRSHLTSQSRQFCFLTVVHDTLKLFDLFIHSTMPARNEK